MTFSSSPTFRRLGALALAAALGFGGGLATFEVAGAANTPSADDGGAIDGVLPVVDSAGNLRRDPQGNLMGIKVSDMVPTSESAAQNRATVSPGDRRTVRTETRTGADGAKRDVTVEEVVTNAADPEASLAKRKLVSIPGTSNVGR